MDDAVRNAVNKTLSVKGTKIKDEMFLKTHWYWSSTEEQHYGPNSAGYFRARMVCMEEPADYVMGPKFNTCYIRAVATF